MGTLADIWKLLEGESAAGIISLSSKLHQWIYSIMLLSSISAQLCYNARSVSYFTGVLQVSLPYFIYHLLSENNHIIYSSVEDTEEKRVYVRACVNEQFSS